MHDTPEKDLFEKQTRIFSSGCIRLEDAKQLADYLLTRDKGWQTGKTDSIIASGKNVRIRLDKPVKIQLCYFTSWVDEYGQLHFVRDTYRKFD